MHPAPTKPEAGSLATRVAGVVLMTVFAPLVVLYQLIVYLFVAASASWAGWRSRATCRALGDRMNAIDIGDQFLRDRVAVALRGLAENPPRDRRKILSAELREALESLGKSGAAAGVPVIGAEREYHAAQRAYNRWDATLARSSASAAKILPHDGVGWGQLFVGCAATGGLIYLIAKQL